MRDTSGMASKVVKLCVVPAALGLASIRVYFADRKKTEQLSPAQLPFYSPLSEQCVCVEDAPGWLQTRLNTMQGKIQPYGHTLTRACVSVKEGTVNLYHAGQDVFQFFRQPPDGFLPRVGVIAVCGLAGIFLAKRGSRMRHVLYSLGLGTVGVAVCYPSETVAVCKLSGRKVFTIVSWSSGIPVKSTWAVSKAESVSTHWREAPPTHTDNERLVPTASAKARFVVDPAIMDHGQSHPDDADLYSTRT